jgi:hypothetical protein
MHKGLPICASISPHTKVLRTPPQLSDKPYFAAFGVASASAA